MNAKIMTKQNCPLEIRQLNEDGTFSGYGSVFGNIDSYGDVVEKGAFARSLKKKKPALLWQHDSSQPIGVWEELKEDEHGLFVRGHLLCGKVARADEVRELLKAKAISGLSIGYIPVKWEYDEVESGECSENIRRLKEIDLWEVSLVTFPANDAARVSGVKSATLRDIEETLRDAGFSRTEAGTLMSRMKNLQRDAELRSHTVKTLEKLTQYLKGK